MKILKYITAVFALLFVIASCEKEVTNPVLEDSDYRVYFYGSGENAYNVAREGFDVLLGTSLEIKLMNSPTQDTQIKWVLASDSSLINETFDYTFAPEVEGLQKTWFVSSRSSGFTDTVTFNFRGVTDGVIKDATSEMNAWKNFEYPDGSINGSFTAEFDMVADKNNTNCITGFLNGVPANGDDFGALSAIIRFTTNGNFDARNGDAYSYVNEIKYSAGLVYHVRMEINAIDMEYDVFITNADGDEVQLADKYGFRKKVSTLDHWNIIAKDAGENSGTHTISNMQLSNIVQNTLPVFGDVDDVDVAEGSKVVTVVKAKDPLGGKIIFTTENLPRFAKFVDNGNGSAQFTFEPYTNCGGCDLGSYDIKIIATSDSGVSEENMKVSVTPDLSDVINVEVDVADATIFESGSTETNPVWTSIDFGAANYGTSTQMNAVMPFALPTIPAGKRIKAAYLKVFVQETNLFTGASMDVYSFTPRATPDVLRSDFYLGSYGGDTSADAIQEGLLVKGSSVGNYSLSDEAAIAFGGVLEGYYSNGAIAGEFVFLRVSPSANSTDWSQAKISAYETADAADRSQLVIVLEDK